MKIELPHYMVGSLYGFDQEQYPDFAMNMGGCAATVAAESCLLLKKHYGMDRLYPFDAEHVTFEDFNTFAMAMKPYLRPRLTGINKLSVYMDGLQTYLDKVGEHRLHMKAVEGSTDYDEAARILMNQLESGLPVPFLMLSNRDNSLNDFIWHWFLLNGYDADASELVDFPEENAEHAAAGPSQDAMNENGPDRAGLPSENAENAPDLTKLLVKACSYGEWVWLPFAKLWYTGYERRGGMILYSIDKKEE